MQSIHCEIADVAVRKLDPTAALDFVSAPEFGGIALFVGRVRQFNLGRTVTGIDYDLFEALALKVFAEIAHRAQAEFGPQIKLYAAHARGLLAVGDLAIVVAVGTPHRDAAFRACRQVVEAVKHTAPIWKQEHYEDSSSEWSEGCSLCELAHSHPQESASS